MSGGQHGHGAHDHPGHDHPGHDQPSHEHSAHRDGAHASPRGHHATGGWRGAANVTLHCLTGCAIGEWIGLAIGVSLHWPVLWTLILAVTLAFVFGYALTLVPLLRSGMAFVAAMKIVWVGETVSIAVMELVMNVIDYSMGGMQPGMSVFSFQYWSAFLAAAVAGFLAAWPVNYGRLSRNFRNPH